MGDESGAAAHSPFVQGLLRYSPNNSAVWTPNSSRLSSTRQRNTRFFEGSTNAVPLDNDKDPGMDNSSSESDDPSGEPAEIDGIPVQHIRKLAIRELLQSPQQASFYASILYSKTNSSDDALLLAHAHLATKKYTSCLRLLEESSLLQSTYPWDALVLACSALAASEEWAALADIAEDACRLPEEDHAAAGNSFARLAPPLPLEDDDDIGWSSLQMSVSKHASPTTASSALASNMHPLAQVLYWRGQAYHATGHFIRAALYWKRALKMDCQCQQAWEALLTYNLIAPAEAHALIQELDFSNGNVKWLRSLYLARIELTPQDVTLPQERGHEDAGQDSFQWDASSIQMSSPMPVFQFGATETTTPVQGAYGLRSNAPANKMTSANQQQIPAILGDVDQAFDTLWNVHKLQHSPQVLAMAARRAYRQYDWKQALAYCEELDQLDPVMTEAAYCYIATLLLLGHKRTLFRLAHAWVEASPRSAQSWFAVGAYYYSCKRYHVAQRHFCRATRLDPQCTEAWIAFGCSFAACDESDQALASFRAAQRLSPGEHTSLLYMGIEYTRTNHLVLSGYFLNAALRSSGGDPLCLHELGVLAFQKKEHAEAIDFFSRALAALVRLDSHAISDCIELCHDPYWEPTIFYLGHAFRKTRQFDLALLCFQRSVALCPGKHSAYSALGFTKHLVEDLDGAIACYHQALSCNADDPFSADMLNRALREALNKGDIFDETMGGSGSSEPFFRSWGTAKDESALKEAEMEYSDDDTMMSS